MADSLILADNFELLAGGVASLIPVLPGAVFRLADPWDFGAPQPTPDLVANMILDGERATGHRAGNRPMSLPLVIRAPTRLILDAARELVMHAIDADNWTLRYTRDDVAGPPLPLIFDCQRAQATVIAYSLIREKQAMPESDIVISFDAAPYGRSDTPQVVEFPSALAGEAPPPAAPPLRDLSLVD